MPLAIFTWARNQHGPHRKDSVGGGARQMFRRWPALRAGPRRNISRTPDLHRPWGYTSLCSAPPKHLLMPTPAANGLPSLRSVMPFAGGGGQSSAWCYAPAPPPKTRDARGFSGGAVRPFRPKMTYVPKWPPTYYQDARRRPATRFISDRHPPPAASVLGSPCGPCGGFAAALRALPSCRFGQSLALCLCCFSEIRY